MESSSSSFAPTPLSFATLAVRADDWPQWMGPQRDGVLRETGLLDRFPKDGPKVLWRSKLAWGYAGPAVADGLVYVLDYQTNDNVTITTTGTTTTIDVNGATTLATCRISYTEAAAAGAAPTITQPGNKAGC